MRTKDLMVENWYKWWPKKRKVSMKIEFIPIQIGVLKINARSAFYYRDRNRKRYVKNFPEFSPYIDQQGYPVNVRRVSIEESSDFLKNFELLANYNKIFSSKEFSEKLQAIINNPQDKSALRYFGITNNYAQASQYISRLKQLIENNPQIRHSPYFLVNLKRLINNPTDSQAHKFFGITIKDEKLSFSEKRLSQATKKAETYITSLQGGFNLISLINSERDISFVPPESSGTIAITYQGKVYSFYRNSNIVLDIAKKITQIKPHSKYISEVDPFSKTSYPMLIEKFQNKKSIPKNDFSYKSKQLNNFSNHTLSKKHKPVFITQLSFTNPMTAKSLLMTVKGMCINKAITAGINSSIQKNINIRFNVINHRLDDNHDNAKRLMNITYNSNLTRDKITEKISRDFLLRNNIDAILYGIYIDKGSSIEIRQHMTVKQSKTYQRYYSFTKKEFFCKDPIRFELVLCPNAFETVSNKVEELLDLLE